MRRRKGAKHDELMILLPLQVPGRRGAASSHGRTVPALLRGHRARLRQQSQFSIHSPIDFHILFMLQMNGITALFLWCLISLHGEAGVIA